MHLSIYIQADPNVHPLSQHTHTQVRPEEVTPSHRPEGRICVGVRPVSLGAFVGAGPVARFWETFVLTFQPELESAFSRLGGDEVTKNIRIAGSVWEYLLSPVQDASSLNYYISQEIVEALMLDHCLHTVLESARYFPRHKP